MKACWRLRTFCSLASGGLACFLLCYLPIAQPRATIDPSADYSVTFSADSRYVALWTNSSPALGGSLKHTQTRQGIHLYDAQTGNHRVILSGSENAYYRKVMFSPDHSRVAAQHGTQFDIWDARTGQYLESGRVPCSGGNVARIFYSTEGELISESGGITYQATTGRVLIDHRELFDGRLTISTGKYYLNVTTEEVQVIDQCSGRLLHRFPGNSRNICDADYYLSPTGDALIEVLKSGKAHYWARPQSQPAVVPSVEADETVIALSPGNHWLALSGTVRQDRLIEYFEKWLKRPSPPTYGVRIRQLKDGQGTALFPNASGACWAPDGNTLAIFRDDDRLELWDFPLRKPWGKIIAGALLAAGLTWGIGWCWTRWRTRTTSS